MAIPRRSLQGDWTSPWIALFALVGAGVGIASLWRFPVLLAEHGAALLIWYGVALLILGLPLLTLELLAGRISRQPPMQAFAALAEVHGLSRHWRWLGLGLLASAFMVLSGLAVVAAWLSGFSFRMIVAGGGALEGPVLSRALSDLVGEPERAMGWMTLFLLAVALPVAGGRRSLERFLCVAVPFMLVLLLALSVSVAAEDHPGAALPPLSPESLFSAEVVLAGVQQAFFGLALASGVAITFGMGVSRGKSVLWLAPVTVLIHGLAAVVAAQLVIGVVGTSTAAANRGGLDLLFHALPPALIGLPHGALLMAGVAVLVLLVLLTSGVAFLQVLVASLRASGLSPARSVSLATSASWLLAMLLLLAYSLWSDWQPVAFWGGLSLADLLNRFTALILLPVTALALSLFMAWRLPRETVLLGLTLVDRTAARLGYLAVRVILPLSLLALFLAGLGFPMNL
ncbi:hypothetical protein M0534_05480 [Methylonatrum kenyense]|uniref:hypothetical protein n=1 Tax=Methylonatrum kenyense TaxID=455253 RepID=UPI0020BEBA39|nr:hypothetical protein [Methylonatrum kenyense]MCK8515776.1 hypothetical protein [Methylonatrum kenyense]